MDMMINTKSEVEKSIVRAIKGLFPALERHMLSFNHLSSHVMSVRMKKMIQIQKPQTQACFNLNERRGRHCTSYRSQLPAVCIYTSHNDSVWLLYFSIRDAVITTGPLCAAASGGPLL